MLCNGPQCVFIPASQLRPCAETFEIIADRGARDAQPGPARGRRLQVDGGTSCSTPARRTIWSRCSAERRRSSTRCARRSRRDEAAAARRRSRCCSCVRRPRGPSEQLLTLYSPPIDSEPYVHKSDDGDAASPTACRRPRGPGYVLGFKEQVLVDSKDPDAKPLPVDKMMVHHFLYYTPGRVDRGPGGCLGGAVPRRARGGAPERAASTALWPARAAGALRRPQRDRPRAARRSGSVTAMVMNHYKQPKRFYVRTKLWYTTEPRTAGLPDRRSATARTSVNGMAYDVPGGGKPGSTFVDRSTWTVPFSGRILGGGVASPRRRAAPDAASAVPAAARCSTPRPTTAPTTTPTTRSARSCTSPGRSPTARSETLQGIPVTAGEVLERDGRALRRRAARGRDGLLGPGLVRDDSVTPCAPMPTDLREVTVPAKYDRARAVRLRPRRAAAVRAARALEGRSPARRSRSATSGSSRSG